MVDFLWKLKADVGICGGLLVVFSEKNPTRILGVFAEYSKNFKVVGICRYFSRVLRNDVHISKKILQNPTIPTGDNYTIFLPNSQTCLTYHFQSIIIINHILIKKVSPVTPRETQRQQIATAPKVPHGLPIYIPHNIFPTTQASLPLETTHDNSNWRGFGGVEQSSTPTLSPAREKLHSSARPLRGLVGVEQ